MAASSRLTGTGEISGSIDVSQLAFGDYHAKLNAFSESTTNEPLTVTFTVSGKLSTPQFKYTQNGTELTITLDSAILTTQGDQQKAEASDESEKLNITVAECTTTEGQTSAYTEQQAAPGMP